MKISGKEFLLGDVYVPDAVREHIVKSGLVKVHASLRSEVMVYHGKWYHPARFAVRPVVASNLLGATNFRWVGEKWERQIIADWPQHYWDA